MDVSVLILTLNEECNIRRCLEALAWCDDIVVLDSYSTDKTLAIAQEMGARVYQREFDDFAGQRNHALENIEFKHNWILHLDADEVMTEELRIEIGNAIPDGRYDAYRIPSKMMFLGKWLRYSGMYPAYQVRLGHKDKLRFKQVGHGQREDVETERVGTLKSPYLHYSFSKGLADWFDRHNRYATNEALEGVNLITNGKLHWRGLLSADRVQRRRTLKDISARLPFRPMLRFIYMYFLRMGFLDGRAGLVYCRLLSIYEYMIVVKMKEIRQKEKELNAG